MSAGSELIRLLDANRPMHIARKIADDVSRSLAGNARRRPAGALGLALDGSLACLTELRDEQLAVAEAQAIAWEVAAYAAIRDDLECSSELLLQACVKEVTKHVA